MNYSEYVQRLIVMAASNATDAVFLSMIPAIIDSAEQRCYRDLDLLTTVTANSSKTATSGARSFTLPTTNHYVTVQDINVITPDTETNPDLGTRNALVPVSKEYLDAVYNSAANSGLPEYFAMLTDQIILFGPFPDKAYTIEVVGTIRPAPISPTNPETFLSLWLPDLFLAASMIFVTGMQRDFGAQSDDPAAAKSWDNEYSKLLASALTEEIRKKFTSGASQSTAKS